MKKLFLILLSTSYLAWADDTIEDVDCEDSDVSCNFAPKSEEAKPIEAIESFEDTPRDFEAEKKALEIELMKAQLQREEKESRMKRLKMASEILASKPYDAYREAKEARKNRQYEALRGAPPLFPVGGIK